MSDHQTLYHLRQIMADLFLATRYEKILQYQYSGASLYVINHKNSDQKTSITTSQFVCPYLEYFIGLVVVLQGLDIMILRL